ncbi:butyrylcholinesterase-like [Planoprotostelium fungivorum]|uniref:Carboxylic ester hydrolase n=1 Tax=Planoprotostelium fungivorum TaxID=1890364 RepID=A0A2P6NVR1_9EUKA|nr:butyrylcholinesterase-like [Planoprotostelium fungivorum]
MDWIGSNLNASRWMAPQPHSPWSEERVTKEFAPACPQNCVLPPIFCPNATSEDCLYMNVFAPLSRESERLLPVMVFIAGGAFVQGDASCPIYRGELNANETETILVTFNYRLGPLGFMYYAPNFTGNYGIQDQRLALQWVQENIKAFGGDPTKVTLFGESAGAASVGIHLMSKKSDNLFHRAIMESNPISIPFKKPNQAQRYSEYFSGKAGCALGDIECMRALPVDKIVEISDNDPWPNLFNISLEIILPWDPTIDGDEVPMQLMQAVSSGNVKNMPILLGSNAQEAVLFVYFILHSRLVSLEYDAAITAIWGWRNYNSIKALYPSGWNPVKDLRPLASELFTDYIFTCPNRRLATALQKLNKRTFVYYYDHPLSFDQYVKKGPGTKLAYLSHAMEANYHSCSTVQTRCVLSEAPPDTPQRGVNFTPEEEVLTRSVLAYWSNFATSEDGTPNYAVNQSLMEVPKDWPPFDDRNMYMRLTTPQVDLLQDPSKDFCQFWDTLGYEWRR